MLKSLLDRYGRWLTPALLLGGFLMDLVTFRALEPGTMFMLNGMYAFAVAAGVIIGDRGAGLLRKFVPMTVQFAFGALLSASLLFYWYGGTLAASWPVMIVVVALMASNEAFRHLFLRPAVQFGVFAFVFFSYCTVMMPYVLRSVSAWVFLLGGAAATIGSLLVAEAIARTDAARAALRNRFRVIAGATFAAFTGLYFLNVIPPIPLSIREAGIYYDVKREGTEYRLDGEGENFFQKMWPGQTLHVEQNGDGRYYAYTAIFAPSSLTARIGHRWQRYDDAAGKWIDAGPPSYYTTRGGRDGGFRGYTYRTISKPGEWRVIVETERGQELGRLHFDIEP